MDRHEEGHWSVRGRAIRIAVTSSWRVLGCFGKLLAIRLMKPKERTTAHSCYYHVSRKGQNYMEDFDWALELPGNVSLVEIKRIGALNGMRV